MSLVLITIAAITLAGISRKSLQLALQASTAQEDLQRRWGRLSSERLLLENSETILENTATSLTPDMKPRWPLPNLVTTKYVLGGLTFHVQIADEDAKVNLNTVFKRSPKKLNQLVSRAMILGEASRITKQIQMPILARSRKVKTPFQSWGQVFRFDEGQGMNDNPTQLRQATSAITCWGTGRLNLQRASDKTILLLAEHDSVKKRQEKLPPQLIRELIAKRREASYESLDGLLEQIELKGTQKSTIRQLFTDQSQCHSLWMTIESPRRTWTRLTIDQPTPASNSSSQTFVY